MLSEVMQATGDASGAKRVMEQARDIAKGVKLNDLLGQMEAAQPAAATPNPLLTPQVGDTQRSKSLPAKKP